MDELGLLSLLLVLIYAVYYLVFAVKPTHLYYQVGSWQQELLFSCPSLKKFYPSVLLINAHLQTVGVKLLRTAPSILYEREYVECERGEVAIDWDSTALDNTEDTTPIVLILHGLVGSSTSKYIRNLVRCIREAGWRPVVYNARGMGTSELKTPLMFNADRTDDVRHVIKHIKNKFPRSPILAAAYSMGANVLTKYLGEEKENCNVLGAVCISNPFDLNGCMKANNSICSKFYAKVLTRDFQNYLERHKHVLKDHVNIKDAMKCHNLWDFDEKVTLKAYKYPSLKDYYERSSCASKLRDVSVPVLFLNSMDDPIVPNFVVDHTVAKENPNLLFAITERGGHTAYLKNFKWWSRAWSDDVIEEFLSALLMKANDRGMSIDCRY